MEVDREELELSDDPEQEQENGQQQIEREPENPFKDNKPQIDSQSTKKCSEGDEAAQFGNDPLTFENQEGEVKGFGTNSQSIQSVDASFLKQINVFSAEVSPIL